MAAVDLVTLLTCDPRTGVVPTDLAGVRTAIDVHGERLTVVSLSLANVEQLSAQVGPELLADGLATLKRRLLPVDAAGWSATAGDHVVVATEVPSAMGRGLEAFLLDALRRPLLVDGRMLTLDVRIGVSAPGRGSGTERIAEANRARSLAGPGRPVRFHDGGLAAELAVHLHLEAHLPQLLADHLQVAFQPVLDVRRGTIAGAESLMRLDHPSLGTLSPGLVLPALRDHDLRRLTRMMLRRAAAAAQAWHRVSGQSRPISVNVPPEHLHDPSLLADVDDALFAAGADPGLLAVEILETGMVQTGQAAEVREGLRGRGVRVAIDDFGMGYSTLPQLARLDADLLKVDHRLVAEVDEGDNPEGSAAGLAVKLGRGLDVPVIAEGVERRRQLDRLRWLNCRYAQGFLIARPMPLEQLLAR